MIKFDFKRSFLLFACLVLTCSSISIVLESPAFAASIFDNTFKTTDELVVKNIQQSSGTSRCRSGISVTHTWQEYIFNKKLSGWKPGEEPKDSDDLRASFKKALEGGSYIVSQNFGTNQYVSILWSEDRSLELVWEKVPEGTSIYARNAYGSITLHCGTGWVGLADEKDGGVYFMGSFSPGNYISVSNDLNIDYSVKNFFISIDKDKYNYPANYEGEQIVAPRKDIKPEFIYNIANKDLQAIPVDIKKDLPNFEYDDGYNMGGFYLQWSLGKCKGDFDDLNKGCKDGYDNVALELLGLDDSFDYSVSEYGNYILELSHKAKMCYRYPSYPATPDHCFFVDLDKKYPDYDFNPTSVTLKIDGRNISGDTREMDCDVAGRCVEQPVYEDCSSFGADIWGRVGCMLDNIQKWFVNIMKFLFVPSSYAIQRFFNKLYVGLQQQFGFLWYPFDFLIKLFNSLASSSDSCSYVVTSVPGVSSGRFFGNNFNLNLCSAERDFPQVYQFSVYFVRIITVLGLFFALYYRIMNFFNGNNSMSVSSSIRNGRRDL